MVAEAAERVSLRPSRTEDILPPLEPRQTFSETKVLLLVSFLHNFSFSGGLNAASARDDHLTPAGLLWASEWPADIRFHACN